MHLHNLHYLCLEWIPACKRNRTTRTCWHMCVHIHHLKLHTRRYLEIQERIEFIRNVRNGIVDTAFHDTCFRYTLFFFFFISLSISNELPASVRLRLYLETDNGSLRLETHMLCISIIIARWNNGGYKRINFVRRTTCLESSWTTNWELDGVWQSSNFTLEP